MPTNTPTIETPRRPVVTPTPGMPRDPASPENPAPPDRNVPLVPPPPVSPQPPPAPVAANPVADNPYGASSIDANTETVAGQMDTLLSAGSPYITRARTSAAQYANRRGLLNSSIAAGAGEAAAIDAALPIASQDAATYGRAADQVRATGLEQQRMSHGLSLDLQLQDAVQQDVLERVRLEHDQTLERMDREQRHELEMTFINGTQRIQELAISEMGAINRTQGLTADQQNRAIADVEQRARAHINYMAEVSNAAPTWDPLFEDIPSLKVVNKAPAPPPAPAPPRSTAPARSTPGTTFKPSKFWIDR